MGDQIGDGTTGDPGPSTVGAAGENHRDPCAQDQAGAVCFGKEGQLLDEHVPGFEFRRQQDVEIPGDL
jgi:hypothetical protein